MLTISMAHFRDIDFEIFTVHFFRIMDTIYECLLMFMFNVCVRLLKRMNNVRVSSFSIVRDKRLLGKSF